MRELTPDVIMKLTSDQIELLVELGDLAQKEAELTEKIDDIRRQEEKVGLGRNSHSTRAIHEDSEFVSLLTLRSVRERADIRDKIRGLLRALINAGLGDLAIVGRQAANYGVEITK
jgi:hypothetical protein